MLILLNFSNIKYKNVFGRIDVKYDFDVIESPQARFFVIGVLNIYGVLECIKVNTFLYII